MLAFDANGKLRLAALASSNTTTLNAESTSLALVRIAIGALPSVLTANQANQAIRAAAEFPALVALIQAALSSDLAPIDSGPVLQSVATTVAQAMSTVSAILDPAPAPRAPSAVAFASPPVTTPLTPNPFKIVSNLEGLISVYVFSTGSEGSVNVVNAMPIAWKAYSSDEVGTRIPIPSSPSSTPDGKMLLPSNSLLKSLLDTIHPWLGPESKNVPGNKGKGFDLTIEDAFAVNAIGIYRGAVSSALSFAGAKGLIPQCDTELAAYSISADELDILAARPSTSHFVDYLTSTAISPMALRQVVAKCTPGANAISSQFFLGLSKVFSGLATIKAIDDASTLAAKAWYTFAYRNTSRSVAVCLGESGFFHTPEIQNCAERFTFENPAPLLVPNARFTPRVTALTAGEQPTGLPIGVTHSSSDAAQAVVTVLTPQNGAPQTGELVANGVGPATITVRDPFSNASGQYTVTVVRPVIRPGVVRMGVGQAMSLSLTDSAGNLVITDGSGLTWTLENEIRGTSSTEPVAALGPFSGGATNTANVYARAPGRVTVTVRIPVLLDPITADIEVFAAPLNTCEADVPTYAPSGCELPRLIARNPYMPILIGQAIPLSDLIAFSVGTCPVSSAAMNVPFGGQNWALGGLPDTYKSFWNDTHFMFLPDPPPPYVIGLLDVSAITLQPLSTGPIRMQVWLNASDVPSGIVLRQSFINCTFQQESGGGGL